MLVQRRCRQRRPNCITSASSMSMSTCGVVWEINFTGTFSARVSQLRWVPSKMAARTDCSQSRTENSRMVLMFSTRSKPRSLSCTPCAPSPELPTQQHRPAVTFPSLTLPRTHWCRTNRPCRDLRLTVSTARKSALYILSCLSDTSSLTVPRLRV